MLKFVFAAVVFLLAGLAFASERVERSVVADIILPNAPFAYDVTVSSAYITALNNAAAGGGRECAVSEAVFWVDSILLTGGYSDVKQGVIRQITRRGWEYRVLGTYSDLDFFVAGNDALIIFGFWQDNSDSLDLTWCLTRGL